MTLQLPVYYPSATPQKRRLIRNLYVSRQNGLCCHCRASLEGEPSVEMQVKKIDQSLFPPGFFRWPVHLHHDHKTGMTIGAVHSLCNAILWQYHGK